ncbi:MAG: hypothetical protein ABIH65_00605 [Nanoarchaeota archaeon]
MKNQANKITSSNNDQSKALILDSGVLISFSMNGLTELIKKLKGIFSGKFLITADVKKEIIDTPIKIKKFELEALKIKKLLDEGVLEMPGSLGINDSEVAKKTAEIINFSDNCFIGDGRNIRLLDIGEASCLALSRILKEKGIKNILAVDERTTRMLVENHKNLRRFLEKKIDVKITVNSKNVNFFRDFNVIRSPELAYIAYKKGLVDLIDGNTVLDALLYALKFKGASISSDEIEEIKSLK